MAAAATYNVSSPTAVVNTAGTLVAISAPAGQVTFTVNDSATVNGASAANQIDQCTLQPGEVKPFYSWPCANGITISKISGVVAVSTS